MRGRAFLDGRTWRLELPPLTLINANQRLHWGTRKDRTAAAHLLFVAEARHLERTQPAPGEDRQPTVRVRITTLEVPSRDQEELVRKAQRALYLQRTATGTLDEDGQVELTEPTLDLLGDALHDAEVARLRAGLDHWTAIAERLNRQPDAALTIPMVKKEISRIAKGLRALLDGTEEDDDA